MEIASPLPFLFEEDRHGDRQAREALFCTFNADLGYFERTVLGVTQSTGARATVVGDGRISDPDPRAARNAGTRYVHGLAVTGSGSAFHPKVTVIAGPERAVVAVGSGNLSSGGWHLNKETWIVATADRERCPVIVAEVAGWLRTLDQVCAITPYAVQGINRTVVLLENLAAAAATEDTGHHLVHTSSGPLLDQLPAGDVDRLLLYSPFHDEKAKAVRRLIERLRPSRVTLAVQTRERTVIQPDAVRDVITDLGVPFDVVEDSEEKYRHGKLVEAISADGSRWTLTGSPNLSARALLLSAADGGNIETGVISRPGVSLFPAECRPITLDEVPAVRITGSAASQGGADVMLLAAVRTSAGLEVVFARSPAETVRIVASHAAEFDRWKDAGSVPAGSATYVLTGVDLPGGTRVRCVYGADADNASGGIVFVTDPALVLIRPGETARHGGTDTPGPAALITDPRLLELWTSALRELASSRPVSSLPRVTAPAVPRGEGADDKTRGGLRLDTDEESWLAYTDDAKAYLGPAMFHFALGGLPGLSAFTGMADSSLREPTDKLVDESRPGLDSDNAVAVGDDTDPDGSAALVKAPDIGNEPGVTHDPDLTERERRRVRRCLDAAVSTDLPGLPAVHRLALLSLVLCAVQAEVWDSPVGDQGWIRIVSKALEKLDREDIPERMSTCAASWAAIAIYLMHEYRPTAGRGAEVLLYEKAAAAVAHLFPAAEAQLVADFAAPFTNKNGYPIDPDAVMHVIDMVVQSDPLAEAIDILGSNHSAWRVDKHNARLLHVHGEIRATFLAAAEALDAVPGTDTAAVWATGGGAGWTIAIRDQGTLVRIEKNSQGQVTWWQYTLGSLTSPTGIARDPELGNRARIRHGALTQPFPAAIQALAAAGVDLSSDPPSECPSDIR
jgi:hypothetical protein